MSEPPSNASQPSQPSEPSSGRRNAALLYGGLVLAAIAVAIGIAVFTSRGGDDKASPITIATPVPATAAAVAATGTDVSLTATDFTFDKKDVELPAASKVTITLKNGGGAPHSLQLLDAKGGKELAAGSTGPVTNPGQSVPVSFTTPGAGTYYFQCGIHPGQMNGTLTVKGAGAPTAVVAAPTAAAGATKLDVTAVDLKFDAATLEAVSGSPVTLTLKNTGQAPHSMQILDAKGGKELAPGSTGKTTQPGTSETLNFSAPAAGTYYFQCGIHPGVMNGTFTVKAAGSGAATPPPVVTGATRLDVTAVDLKFDAATLEAPSGSAVTLTLKNNGQAPHSMQILDAKGGKELAPGSTGKTTQPGLVELLTFTAPAAGTYYFQCGIHPGVMNGTFTVKAAGAAVPTQPAGLPSVTPPSVQSRLSSGAIVQVIAATNLYVDPSGSARVIQPLKVGDRLVVVTNTPPGGTVVITEGLIFWRVVLQGTQTVGWVPEVTSAGDRRFVDIAR